MTEKPNLLSRAVQKLSGRPEPKVVHPFDCYRNPDAEFPTDSVTVRTLSAEDANRAAGNLSDAQKDGFKVEAAAQNQIEARRYIARYRAEQGSR